MRPIGMKFLSLTLAVATASSVLRAAPNLTPGVWTKISPPEAASGYGCASLTIDPSNPNVLYLPTDMQGLWKSTDRGATWTRLGDPALSSFAPGPTAALDSPIRIEVDPANPQHLYATQGVRGKSMGFWISWDGGLNWSMPQGFRDLHVPNSDVTTLSVNPTDFNHILVGGHPSENQGVLESKDGGTTFTRHPAHSEWPGGTMGISFLYHPSSGKGDSRTWLVGTDGRGFWRTTDGGAHWAEVFADGNVRINITHGGHSTFYTSAGVLYAGGDPYPVRSFDNGATWEKLTDLRYSHYGAVHGDGTYLYTSNSFPTLNGLDPYPIHVSLETDGASWDPYQGGAQTFTNGPFGMAFDSVNKIMYGAMWNQGLWALKVLPRTPPDGVPPARPRGLRAR